MTGGHLPIHAVSGAIVNALNKCNRLILTAETGSGKSTQVPQILLDNFQLAGEILILQPRRIAARLLAMRVAQERHTEIGDSIGYQVRFENKSSRQTRVRYLTEGLLLPKLLKDPELAGVSAIIFDEFHERNLNAELCLAHIIHNQSIGIRRDLKIIVMSATLDLTKLSSFLAPCAHLNAEGRHYPVAIQYAGASSGRTLPPIWERAADAFKRSHKARFSGHVLIFMPGVYEIHRCMRCLESIQEAGEYRILPLHGSLSPAQQDAATASKVGQKIIVATNVAETSITIDGVGLVIDGGQAKVAKYDSRRGINTLLLEPISQAAADQRAGRAGRTQSGQCIRLWSEAEQRTRSSHSIPEIHRVDLAEKLLVLMAAGQSDFETFAWYEAPKNEAIAAALILLQQLGAIDEKKRITGIGLQMARLPLHPRYARILLGENNESLLPALTWVAAMSQERWPYQPNSQDLNAANKPTSFDLADGDQSDFFVQIRALEWAQNCHFDSSQCRQMGIHVAAARQITRIREQLLHLLQVPPQSIPQRVDFSECSGRLCQSILLGFSDYLAQRSESGTLRYRLLNGRTGMLRKTSQLRAPLIIVADQAELNRGQALSLELSMATNVELDFLEKQFPCDFIRDHVTTYDSRQRRVVQLERIQFRGMTLSQVSAPVSNLEKAASLLAAQILSGHLILKNWDAAVDRFISRVNFIAQHCPDVGIDAIDEAGKCLILEQICYGAVDYKSIKNRPVLSFFQDWIRPEQQYYLDRYAPESLTIPDRKRPLKIRYESDGRAIISSRLQDFYKVKQQDLLLANGIIRPLIELLAPNNRVVHLTDDIDGFWSGAYRSIRKELAGRYPKHDWPEWS